MPFNLRITFTGMCLFVQDQATRLTHVLLLAPDLGPVRCDTPMQTAGKSKAAQAPAPMLMPRHYPRIFYPTVLDKAPPSRPSNDFRCLSLDDKVLDLSAYGGTGWKAITLPDEIVRLDNLVQPLDRRWISAAADDQVSARIVLPPADSITPNNCEQCVLGGSHGPAATSVTWELNNIAADQLNWHLDGLRLDGGISLRALDPATTDGVVELRIKNVIHECCKAEEVIGTPPSDMRVPHFSAYYGPFNTNGPDLIIQPNTNSGGRINELSDFYTCMSAQAPLQPSN